MTKFDYEETAVFVEDSRPLTWEETAIIVFAAMFLGAAVVLVITACQGLL